MEMCFATESRPLKQVFFLTSETFIYQQECIPVGCVPAARRPYAGVCFRGGGGCLPGPRGGCLPGPGGGGLPDPGMGGVSMLRGGLPDPGMGGVSMLRGGGVWHPSMH